MIKQAISPSSTYLGKRRFDENDEADVNMNYLSSTEQNVTREKSRRLDDSANFQQKAFQAEHVKFLESQLLSLRVEQQIIQEKKEAEIMQLQAVIHLLREQNQRIVMEKNSCIEENNLLKRAVHLLDRKQKDSSGQVQQLQQILVQATDQISELERQNRNLSYHLSLLQRGSNGLIDHQPPDVF